MLVANQRPIRLNDEINRLGNEAWAHNIRETLMGPGLAICAKPGQGS